MIRQDHFVRFFQVKQTRRIFASAAMLAMSACAAHAPLHQAKAKSKPVQQQTAGTQATRIQALENMTPGFLYMAADHAMKDGNHALAIEFLEALVKKDPAAIEPHIQLTQLLLEFGKSEQAAKHLDRLLSTPELPESMLQQLQLLRVRLYLEQGQTDKALQATNDFLKAHPIHIMARNIQAKIFSREKRFDEALNAIAAAIRIKELPEFRLLQAQLLLKSGNIISAKKSLRRMQQLDPDREAPTLLLSTLALKSNQPDKAEKLLRTFIRAHPDALRIHLALGKVLIQQHRVFDAILVYQKLADISAHNPEILRQLGMLYFENKNYVEAGKTFRQLSDAQPDDRNRFYLAASLEAQGKRDEAETIYSHIDAGSAMAIEAQVRLAAIEISHDDLAQASKRLLQVIKAKPVHMDAQLMLSSIRLNQHQYQTLLDETAALASNSKVLPQILFNRAVAFEHFKQYDQSDAMLARILRRNPNHSEALNFLGYSYASRGIHLNKAKVLIQRALIQKPGDGYYMDSLAWAYYKSGDYAKAVSMQAKALKKVPDDAVMREHYGDILWKAGNMKGARQAWQQAIDLKPEHPDQLRKKIRSGVMPDK